MPVDSTHPDYDEALPKWERMRATISGEDAVKDEGEKYLPMPSGFLSMDDQGVRAYGAYKTRAKFPAIVAPTIRGMTGVIHRTEIQIELPDALDGLWEKATPDGLSLEALARRITREVLSTGRYGLLVDMPSDAKSGDIPFIATYVAETIKNWSKQGDFFVLDESEKVRVGFEWEDHRKFRELEIKDGTYTVTIHEPDGATASVNPSDKSSETAPQEGVATEPQMQGGKKFETIPFVVIGSTDVMADIDEIPLLGVAQCALAAYRLDADYRHQLYMSGQETLVLTNCDKKDAPTAVGAGACITLPENATAEYVGPTCNGIEAHRTAIQDESEAAILAGARLFDGGKKAAESGEALRIRFASQTATLTTVALCAAQGLEKALKFAAMFVGADPEKVVVKANLSFIDSTLTPVEAKGLMELWLGGAISKRTMHENLQRGEISSSERTFEQEEREIEENPPALGGIDDEDGGSDGFGAGEDDIPADQKAARKKKTPATKKGGKSRFVETGKGLEIE